MDRISSIRLLGKSERLMLTDFCCLNTTVPGVCVLNTLLKGLNTAYDLGGLVGGWGGGYTLIAVCIIKIRQLNRLP